MKEIQFDHLGAFKYSPEEETSASRLPGPVAEPVKEERLGTLMDLQRKISLKRYQALVGGRAEVVVDKPDHRREFSRGRLKTQAPEIDGSVLLKGKARPGTWVEARITRARSYDLVGEIERTLP